MHDFSVERLHCRHPLRMVEMTRVPKSTLVRGGTAALVIAWALGGCHARTELADVTDGGDGPRAGTSSQPTGGSTSAGAGRSAGGTSSGAGGTGGTGGAADTGGSLAGGGTGTGGGECWEPTVENFCDNFGCPDRNHRGLENAFDYFEETGVCDAFTVWVDTDTCGSQIFRYSGGDSSESFLYVTGTLGAAAISRDTQFGPCDRSHYYGGIELDEYNRLYGCSIVNRCVACGPSSPDDARYPPCRFDCPCVDIEPGIDPCFGGDSCECYCYQGRPKDD